MTGYWGLKLQRGEEQFVAAFCRLGRTRCFACLGLKICQFWADILGVLEWTLPGGWEQVAQVWTLMRGIQRSLGIR